MALTLPEDVKNCKCSCHEKRNIAEREFKIISKSGSDSKPGDDSHSKEKRLTESSSKDNEVSCQNLTIK